MEAGQAQPPGRYFIKGRGPAPIAIDFVCVPPLTEHRFPSPMSHFQSAKCELVRRPLNRCADGLRGSAARERAAQTPVLKQMGLKV